MPLRKIPGRKSAADYLREHRERVADVMKHVKVVSDEEAEKLDYVVCVPEGPSPFTDNLIGNCCKCGVRVMYRWHAPRKPPKICLDCLNKQLIEEAKDVRNP
jgi:hypothetical protein